MSIKLSLFFIVLSASLTKLFCFMAQNTRLMSNPSERSLHSIPTVRGGGLVFIGLSLLSLPILCYFDYSTLSEHYILMSSIFLVATISFLDDLYDLSVTSRFLVQSFVALLIVLFMRPEHLDFILFDIKNVYLIIPILFFTVLWAINHFNFMDGLDGFCASQALFLFASYGVLLGFHGASIYADFCFVLVFSLVGFLVFNFPPAKLFMGDVGSATLGLLTFVIALIAQQKYQIPILYWIMLNALFLFDATITLVRRMIKKEQWSEPHKKHAYQRLKQLGMDGRVILLGQFLINGMFFLLVLLAQLQRINLSLLLAWEIAVIFLIYYVIEQFFPMFQSVES